MNALPAPNAAPDDDAYDGPSKSQRKRDMHALQALGERLVGLPASQLEVGGVGGVEEHGAAVAASGTLADVGLDRTVTQQPLEATNLLFGGFGLGPEALGGGPRFLGGATGVGHSGFLGGHVGIQFGDSGFEHRVLGLQGVELGGTGGPLATDFVTSGAGVGRLGAGTVEGGSEDAEEEGGGERQGGGSAAPPTRGAVVVTQAQHRQRD